MVLELCKVSGFLGFGIESLSHGLSLCTLSTDFITVVTAFISVVSVFVICGYWLL